MGAHPFHHRCLGLYSCLASACRVCAKTGAGCTALRRAALYGLLQSAAAEAMLAVGTNTHLLGARIRPWSFIKDQKPDSTWRAVC